MNLKNYVFVVLVIVGLAACKKNRSDNPGQKSSGEDTKISLSLSIASSGTKTYAGGDANATAEELEMNTVDIFIYDNVSPFALTHKHFEDKDAGIADFEDGTVEDGTLGARRLKNGIVLDAKTGDKLIYVGVNLPKIYVTQIKATQGLASLEGVFDASQMYNKIFDNLYSNGMPMFSKVGADLTLGNIPATNKVTLELTRMMAKVTVDGTDDFNIKIGGVVDNLMPVVGGAIDVSTLFYSLNQVNDKTYLKGNKIVDRGINTGFFDKAFSPLPLNSLTPKYVTENLAENDLANLTYAVVKARFIPEVFEDAGTYNIGATFFTITDPANGSVKYYMNPAAASAAAALDVNKEFRMYVGGNCYYHIYLDPTKDHKVVRNEYYQVKISAIRGIGKSSSAVALMREGSLRNAELLDLTAKATTLYVPTLAATNANIEATVTIVPWKKVAFEHEL